MAPILAQTASQSVLVALDLLLHHLQFYLRKDYNSASPAHIGLLLIKLVMAFFVLLTTFSDNFTCTVYSDSQSLINTYNEVIYNLKPSRNFRRPMFPIWNLIHAWIYELRLNITLLKVKGHSDDIYNNHAD